MTLKYLEESGFACDFSEYNLSKRDLFRAPSKLTQQQSSFQALHDVMVRDLPLCFLSLPTYFWCLLEDVCVMCSYFDSCKER